MDAGDNHIGFIDGQGEPGKARNKTFKDTQLVERQQSGPSTCQLNAPPVVLW